MVIGCFVMKLTAPSQSRSTTLPAATANFSPDASTRLPIADCRLPIADCR
jgi:hypothetical protein